MLVHMILFFHSQADVPSIFTAVSSWTHEKKNKKKQRHQIYELFFGAMTKLQVL